MVLSDEEAKATQEVAKTTSKALDVVSGAGSALVGSTIAAVPGDLIGVLGADWLHEKRRRNRARMEAKTATILDQIDQTRLSEPSPAMVLPLLEASSDEDREELQDLWAALLANAMVDGGRRVRRDYFETVRRMEPMDAVVLDIISRRPNPHTNEMGAVQVDRDFFAWERQHVSMSADDWIISIDKLDRLGCVKPDRAAVPSLTAFGRGLLVACKPP